MASTSEVGHAKNVAHFNLLKTHVNALGPIYNPTNSILLLTNLNDVYAAANAVQHAVNELTAPYAFAVDDRDAEFKPLSPNLTRLRMAYKVTDGVTQAHMDDLMTIIRKLKGKRNPATASASGTGTIQHSVSQLSFDQRTNNMDLLIAHLVNTPNYAPNEAEYTIAGYKDKKIRMLLKTQAVADTYIPLNSARSARDYALYQAPDNLVDVGNKVKDYISTILPKSSPQYKAIMAIKFKKQSVYS